MAEPLFNEPGSEFVARHTSTQKGLIGFLIRHRIAKDEAQANLILVGALALALIGIAAVTFSSRATGARYGNLEEQARLHPEWGIGPGQTPRQ